MSEALRIVKPSITMNPNDKFEDLLQKLYAEGWRVNSNLKGNTIEEAVENQAKVFPCVEFQPIQLPEGEWIAFHRTPIEEWLKTQQEPQKTSIPQDIEEARKTKPLPPIATTQEEEEAKLWQNDELPCAKDSFTEAECKECPDPCTNKCSMGVSLADAGKDEACLTCQTRECEAPKQELPEKTQKQTTLF